MVKQKIFYPLKAIRQNCLKCMGGPENSGHTRLVRECSSRESCHLWPYRFGMGLQAALKRGYDVTP